MRKEQSNSCPPPYAEAFLDWAAARLASSPPDGFTVAKTAFATFTDFLICFVIFVFLFANGLSFKLQPPYFKFVQVAREIDGRASKLFGGIWPFQQKDQNIF